MANRVRGELEVKIVGKLVKLVPSWEGIAEVEDKAGVGVIGLAFRFQNNDIGFKNMCALIWGGMVGSGERPFENYRELCEAVRKTGLVKFVKPVSQFLSECVAGDVEDEESPKPKSGE